MITVEKLEKGTYFDDAFKISFRYDPTTVAKVKELAERRYLPEDRAWEIPAHELPALIEKVGLKKDGKVVAEKWIPSILVSDPEATKYCLKLDVRKYYPSIVHDVLKAKYRELFKDEELIWLMDEIIDSISTCPATEENIEILQRLGVAVNIIIDDNGNTEMVGAIKELATEVKYMRGDLNETIERLNKLESKDGDKWEKFKWLIVAGLVTLILGYLAVSVGLK